MRAKWERGLSPFSAWRGRAGMAHMRVLQQSRGLSVSNCSVARTRRWEACLDAAIRAVSARTTGWLNEVDGARVQMAGGDVLCMTCHRAAHPDIVVVQPQQQCMHASTAAAAAHRRWDGRRACAQAAGRGSWRAMIRGAVSTGFTVYDRGSGGRPVGRTGTEAHSAKAHRGRPERVG
jgi:hypothetical protein